MNHFIKVLSVSILSMSALDVVYAADAHQRKQIVVCQNKSEGTPVTYAYKGVIFNGTCQSTHEGKLKFQPPMPAENAPPAMTEPVIIQEDLSTPQPITTPVIQSAPTGTQPVAPQTPSPHMTE